MSDTKDFFDNLTALAKELESLRAERVHDLNQIGGLQEENARLKDEVERLKSIVGADAIDREHGMCCDSSSEIARLKSEVERLTNCKAEADRLKAEVERLNDAITRGAIIPDPKPE